MNEFDINQLDFAKMSGLVPAIAQDYKTGQVLMLGFMNREALERTLQSGKVHYFSRTKNKLWMKGETSGNIQIVKEIWTDCDTDSILIKIEQVGGRTCHTGEKSCFYRKVK